MPLAFIPAVLIVMKLVYAISAYPAGVLSDRWGRKPVLYIGIVTLIIADLVLASSPTLIMTLMGVGLGHNFPIACIPGDGVA